MIIKNIFFNYLTLINALTNNEQYIFIVFININ